MRKSLIWIKENIKKLLIIWLLTIDINIEDVFKKEKIRFI